MTEKVNFDAEQYRIGLKSLGVDVKIIDEASDEDLQMLMAQTIAQTMGSGAAGKPHWKEMQSAEDREEALAKAEAKRERKRLKKSRYAQDKYADNEVLSD